MKRIFLLMLTVCAYLSVCLAQGNRLKAKVVTIEWNSTFGPSVAPSVAKAQVLERAKIEAIGQNFGTVVTETSVSVIKDGKSDYSSYGVCDVRGEWIETISEDWETNSAGNEINYKVRLKGRIREWNASAVDVQATLLCNGTDLEKNKLRLNTYLDGDSVYAHFRTPEDGYLAIFITDESEQRIVQRLLPYPGQKTAVAYPVEADKDYFFFSRGKATSAERRYVRKILMACNEQTETSQFYFVFSTQPFSRPNDVMVDKNKPNQLTFSDFHQWLAEHRKKDSNMVVRKEFVEIRKR